MILEKTRAAQIWDDRLATLSAPDHAQSLAQMKSHMEGFLDLSDESELALRPLFLPEGHNELLANVSEGILKICAKAFALKNKLHPNSLLGTSGIHPDAHAFFASDVQGLKDIARMARMDIVMSNGHPYVVEANVGSALGGSLTIHKASEFYTNLPVARDVSRETSYSFTSPMPAIVDLLKKLGRETGLEKAPRVAVLEWDFLQEINEQFAAYLRNSGIPAAFVNPDELEFKERRLFYRGQPLDIGLRHYHILDLDFPEDTPFLKPLYESGTDCDTVLFSNENATLMSDKRLFGFIFDHFDLLTDAEQALAETFLPWSSHAQRPSQTVRYKGESTSLESLLDPSRRAQFLLKEGVSLEGKGVVIGRETTEHEWNEAVQKAFATGRYVAQEFHPADQIELPFFYDGKVTSEICPFVLGQFVFDGCGRSGTILRYTKSGRTAVINKARGAQVSCVFYERQT